MTDYGTFWVTTEIISHGGRWSGVYRVATMVGKREVEVTRWYYTEDEAEREILRLREIEDALYEGQQATAQA